MEQKARRFRIITPPPPTRVIKWLRIGLFAALTGTIGGLFAVVAVYSYYAPTVPVFASLEDYQPKLGTRVFSGDHQLIGEFAALSRLVSELEKVTV